MRLNLFNFAFKNISRDFKTYFFHFVSCAFSVFVFFVFTNLSFHPALQVVDKDSTIGIVLKLGLIVSLIFSFVFILYSVTNFLKQRSRQFAILNIIGSSNTQFKRLIFYENGLISLCAIGCGIIIGLVFSKFFLMIAEIVIGDLQLYFYFPMKAIIYTILLMGGLFLSISIIAPIILRKKKIISLLKKEDEAEKSYILIMTVAVIIIIPILIYNRHNDSLLMYPVYLIAFVLMSYFTFNVIFIIYEFIMKYTQKMFKGVNLIKISNFKYNNHTNLKTMTISMTLFTVILTSLIYIIGAPKNVEKTTYKILPYSHMYSAFNKNVDDVNQAHKIETILSKEDGFKSLQVNYLKLATPDRDVVLSNATYNKIAEFLNRKPINLKKKDYYMVGTDGKNMPTMGPLLEQDLKKLGVSHNKGATSHTIALSGYFTNVTVVSDEKYQELTHDLDSDRFFAFNIKNWKSYNDEALKDKLNSNGQDDSLSSAYWYYTEEKLQRGIIAYVGSVLCISFLIGIASITYSRLYTSAETEIKKYQTMIKLGLSKKAIKSALASTIKWIFVLPFLIALITTWFIVIYLNQFTLSSYFKIAIYCSSLYLTIEVLLYFIIKHKYQNKILSALYRDK